MLTTALSPAVAAGPPERPDHQGNQGRGFRATEVIAHRGASGYRPEHTMGAYELAIEQCADYIEPDLVMTQDGVLVDRHENEISGTTDVADRPEFADRYTTKTVDGRAISGWFTEDFTLAELKTLRAVERLPDLRPDNTAYDGTWDVPTFEEVLELAEGTETCAGEQLGVIPEIKHSTYFDGLGLSMEEPVVELLDDYGFDGKLDPVVIQSFEVSNLRELDRMTTVKLAQLISCSGAPYDPAELGDMVGEVQVFLDAGMDQFFTDHPDLGVEAVRTRR